MFDESFELKLRNGIEWSCEGIRIQSKLSDSNNLDINLWPQYPHNTKIKLMTNLSSTLNSKTIRVQDLVGDGFTGNQGRGYGSLIVNTLIQLLQRLVTEQKDWVVLGFVSNGQGAIDEDNEARCGFWRQFGFTISSTNSMRCNLNNLKLVGKDVEGKTSAIININHFYNTTKTPPLLEKDFEKLNSVNFNVLLCEGTPNDEHLKHAESKEKVAWGLIRFSSFLLTALFAAYLYSQKINFEIISIVIGSFVVWHLSFFGIYWLWYELSLKVKKPLLLRAEDAVKEKINSFLQKRNDYITELEGKYGFLWRLEQLFGDKNLSHEQRSLFLKSKSSRLYDDQDFEGYVGLIEMISENHENQH